MPKSEESAVLAQAVDDYKSPPVTTIIPSSLISDEISYPVNDFLSEVTRIYSYYNIYKNGSDFDSEGSNGDYKASNLKYKMSASLIDKEARFLFSETPTITVRPKDTSIEPSEDIAKNFALMQELVDSVLDANHFGQQIVRAAKDCFIGKRVAAIVNFNEVDGISLTFIPSPQFLYEYDATQRELNKFVAFVVVRNSTKLESRRILKKKYERVRENDEFVVYIDEELYDGAGRRIDELTPRQPIKLDRIPAVVILNDGLLGDLDGESEIENLSYYESWYSKLSNADIDAERKGMNSIKYVVDMDAASTKNLSSAPGAFWDLGSDQALPTPKTMVGSLESSMNYSDPLQTTLDRIKTTGYEQVDMPNITLQSMQGAITSGKALKAVYWPLIIRCKEKMKTWAPHLSQIASLIIDGSIAYPDCASSYVDTVPSEMAYEVEVEQNTPLPEDETEEKSIDLSEVAAQAMSKKAYMKKWRGLSDREADEELRQIAYERMLLEEGGYPGTNGETVSDTSGSVLLSAIDPDQQGDTRGSGEPEIPVNQNGPQPVQMADDTFGGSADDGGDTTGTDSSRTLADRGHV